MAAFYTVGQLRERLSSIVHRDLVFIDALNELGNLAYTSRWPDSTRTFRVPAEDIYQSEDSAGFLDQWFLDIDAETYDGAIGFRVNNFGYEVRSHAENFREYPTGWNGFIDHGLKVDSAGADEKRVYRLPNGITDSDPIICWAKKRWIDLYLDSDKYPIRSIAAIKVGLLALGHQNENELEKAGALFQQFTTMMEMDSRQFHGPKRAKIIVRPWYNNRPRSFR